VSARDVFDRHLRLVEARDLEGLVGQYHEDAVVVRFAGVHRGRDEVRGHLTTLLAQQPKVLRVVDVADGGDVLLYHLELELGGKPVRTHGTLLLRGERILRQTTGVFPEAAGAARGKAQVQVDLEPYTAWPLRPLPDVRSAGREVLGPVLLEIVGAEGPVLADYAYRQVVRAGGGKALTTIARAPLSGAAHRLKTAGAIEIVDDDGQEVLRPTGSPPVRVRELGPRALDEVPPSELAELVRRLAAAGATDLPRATLDAYGLVRMTAKAQTLLERAVAVAQGA